MRGRYDMIHGREAGGEERSMGGGGLGLGDVHVDVFASVQRTERLLLDGPVWCDDVFTGPPRQYFFGRRLAG